jgi:hypothetical protein
MQARSWHASARGHVRPGAWPDEKRNGGPRPRAGATTRGLSERLSPHSAKVYDIGPGAGEPSDPASPQVTPLFGVAGAHVEARQQPLQVKRIRPLCARGILEELGVHNRVFGYQTSTAIVLERNYDWECERRAPRQRQLHRGVRRPPHGVSGTLRHEASRLGMQRCWR